MQVAFYKKIIINSGYYKLDTTTYFCEVPLFLGSRKTDTIFLAKSFKGYRNDKWLYWDTTGNIIKEEIWESGVLEEDPDKK